MTTEEFNNLSPEDRLEYLERGGQVSQSSSEDNGLPKAVEPEYKPVEDKEDRRVSTVTQQARTFSTPSEENPVNVYAFKNPVELLFFLDDDIRAGRVKLHPWQVQHMMDFASGVYGGKTDLDPFQCVVRAANGSGKDKYIIAPEAVWLAMCTTTYASCVVTSSSGTQLDNQTCTYIEQLCKAANEKIHPKVWKINYRYYECLDTRSPVMCFATDEPGKAEGYHPLKYGSKMALFESEAKSVPDDIYNAQNKCTGYTHRVIVSTPGLSRGHFYKLDGIAIERKVLDQGYEKQPTDYIKYLVTAFDCPHLSKNYIRQMERDLPGGKNGAAYKSQIEAEFGISDEMVVIPLIYVKRSVNGKIQHLTEPFNTGGLDLSDGGAETVLVVRNGNKVINILPFRFDNTEDTINFLDQKFPDYGLDHPDSLIFADCCGIGKPMLNSLKRRGWKNIRYIDSRNTPYEPKVYSNRGTELFFNTGKLFERNELILPEDDMLIDQLATRYYKILSTGKHALMSKLEQRSKGYLSPDRADAFNLAFWNYKSTWVDVDSQNAKEIEKEYKDRYETDSRVGAFSLKTWANGSDSPTNRLGKRPDMSLLMEQIRLHNRNIKLQNTKVN